MTVNMPIGGARFGAGFSDVSYDDVRDDVVADGYTPDCPPEIRMLQTLDINNDGLTDSVNVMSVFAMECSGIEERVYIRMGTGDNTRQILKLFAPLDLPEYLRFFSDNSSMESRRLQAASREGAQLFSHGDLVEITGLPSRPIQGRIDRFIFELDENNQPGPIQVQLSTEEGQIYALLDNLRLVCCAAQLDQLSERVLEDSQARMKDVWDQRDEILEYASFECLNSYPRYKVRKLELELATDLESRVMALGLNEVDKKFVLEKLDEQVGFHDSIEAIAR